VGCDVAGSLVSIQVNKSGGNAEVVTLTRMSTEAMSDRRAMFDIFTNARNLSKQREDRATATLLDRAIILWTKMLDDDAKHNRRSEHTDETLLESYFLTELFTGDLCDMIQMCICGLSEIADPTIFAKCVMYLRSCTLKCQMHYSCVRDSTRDW